MIKQLISITMFVNPSHYSSLRPAHPFSFPSQFLRIFTGIAIWIRSLENCYCLKVVETCFSSQFVELIFDESWLKPITLHICGHIWHSLKELKLCQAYFVKMCESIVCHFLDNLLLLLALIFEDHHRMSENFSHLSYWINEPGVLAYPFSTFQIFITYDYFQSWLKFFEGGWGGERTSNSHWNRMAANRSPITSLTLIIYSFLQQLRSLDFCFFFFFHICVNFTCYFPSLTNVQIIGLSSHSQIFSYILFSVAKIVFDEIWANISTYILIALGYQ